MWRRMNSLRLPGPEQGKPLRAARARWYPASTRVTPWLFGDTITLPRTSRPTRQATTTIGARISTVDPRHREAALGQPMTAPGDLVPSPMVDQGDEEAERGCDGEEAKHPTNERHGLHSLVQPVAPSCLLRLPACRSPTQARLPAESESIG